MILIVSPGFQFAKLDSDAVRSVLRTIRSQNHSPEEDGLYHCYCPKFLIEELEQDMDIQQIYFEARTELPLFNGSVNNIYGMKFFPLDTTDAIINGYFWFSVRGSRVVVK